VSSGNAQDFRLDYERGERDTYSQEKSWDLEMLVVLVGFLANSRHEVEKFRVEFGIWRVEVGG